MANAKKCDKCGCFYDPYVVKGAVSQNGRYPQFSGTVIFPETLGGYCYDLCSNCFTEITSLFNIELYVKKDGGNSCT